MWESQKMLIEELQREASQKMNKAFEVLKDELRRVHTGRANPGLVETIRVSYYGTMTPLKQLASITTPEPRLIVIRPYDPSALSEVEKAILQSDLGFAPTSDGKLLRLVVPQLSEETRKQIAGAVKKLGEETKVAIRNVRRDANKQLEQDKKAAEISEDDLFRAKEEVLKLTHNHEEEVDRLIEHKSREIMEI